MPEALPRPLIPVDFIRNKAQFFRDFSGTDGYSSAGFIHLFPATIHLPNGTDGSHGTAAVITDWGTNAIHPFFMFLKVGGPAPEPACFDIRKDFINFGYCSGCFPDRGTVSKNVPYLIRGFIHQQ